MRAGTTIRPATVADVRGIAAIYRHYVTTSLATFELVPPHEAEMAKRMAAIVDAKYPYLVAVADHDGDVLGYAYSGPFKPREAYRFTTEESIYVRADAVGLGLGRALLRAVIEHATTQGLRQMVAVISDPGGPAGSKSVALHVKEGFRAAGLLPNVGWKFGRWVDVATYVKPLADGAKSPPQAKL